MTTPVHCTIRPGALRVRLPRDRPGVPAPKTRIQWDRLWRLAAGRSLVPRTPAEPTGRAPERTGQAPGLMMCRSMALATAPARLSTPNLA